MVLTVGLAGTDEADHNFMERLSAGGAEGEGEEGYPSCRRILLVDKMLQVAILYRSPVLFGYHRCMTEIKRP